MMLSKCSIYNNKKLEPSSLEHFSQEPGLFDSLGLNTPQNYVHL